MGMEAEKLAAAVGLSSIIIFSGNAPRPGSAPSSAFHQLKMIFSSHGTVLREIANWSSQGRCVGAVNIVSCLPMRDNPFRNAGMIMRNRQISLLSELSTTLDHR